VLRPAGACRTRRGLAVGHPRRRSESAGGVAGRATAHEILARANARLERFDLLLKAGDGRLLVGGR
jgi:hypothetical protein